MPEGEPNRESIFIQELLKKLAHTDVQRVLGQEGINFIIQKINSGKGRAPEPIVEKVETGVIAAIDHSDSSAAKLELSEEEQKIVAFFQENYSDAEKNSVKGRLQRHVDSFSSEKEGQAQDIINAVGACRHEKAVDIKKALEDYLQQWKKNIDEMQTILQNERNWVKGKKFQEAKEIVRRLVGETAGEINVGVEWVGREKAVGCVTQKKYQLEDLGVNNELLGIFGLKVFGPELVGKSLSARRKEMIGKNSVEECVERVIDPFVSSGEGAKVEEVLSFGILFSRTNDIQTQARVRAGDYPRT